MAESIHRVVVSKEGVEGKLLYYMESSQVQLLAWKAPEGLKFVVTECIGLLSTCDKVVTEFNSLLTPQAQEASLITNCEKCGAVVHRHSSMHVCSGKRG